MSENVYWMLELAVHPTEHAELRSLMNEMVDTARNEPGTLNYEWNVSADHSVCHVYVRYRDSAAVLEHMHSFGTRFSNRFLALTKITRMTVYGTPSAEVRQALAPYNPAYFSPFGGFNR